MSKETTETLSLQTVDYVASAVKAALGAIPFAGSLLAEIAGYVIPNQRVDRITKFAYELELRLACLEQGFVRAKLTDENFTDLVEEGLRQAARSLSDERRQHIASLIANSLTAEDIQFVEARHLLRLLGEINDIEVIWLRFHLVRTQQDAREFLEKHPTIFEPVRAFNGSPPEVHEKAALQESYKEHLNQLGLLQPTYRTDNRTRMPEFNDRTGAMQIRSYEIAPMGRLLLKYIGLAGNNC